MQWKRLKVPVDGAELAAELVSPDGGGPHPVMVLLHGAGEGTRDFYRAHASAFVEAGVAALIFDRRGEGESTGERDMNLYLLARDAAAMIAAVRRESLIDSKRAGLWGYSNGAWVATLAAAECDPACLVLAGAAGVSPAESEVFRRTEDVRRQGISGASLEAIETAWRILFAYMGHGQWDPAWDADLARCEQAIRADPAVAALPVSDLVKANPRLDSVPRFGTPAFDDIRGRLGGISPDFAFDPIPVLEQLSCPVLVVLAEEDANVPLALSLPRFEAVARAKRGSFEVRVLSGADHLFSSPEYAARSAGESIHPPRKAADYRADFLAPMAQWVAVQSRLPVG